MDDNEVSSVNVRQLISVYENSAPNEGIRQRTRSLGNILGKDVIVRSHDYNSFRDVQEALTIIEEDLSAYQIYDKARHVKFQEILFTLLTSVINIEANVNEDPATKKTLITQTQKLVTVLNQKLPNSASYIKPSETYIGSTENLSSRTASISDGEFLETEYSVSVQKLKQNFQLTHDMKSSSNAKSNSRIIFHRNESNKKIVNGANNRLIEEPIKVKEKPLLLSGVNDVVDAPSKALEQEEDKTETSISVTKLRTIFEQKERENKTGLELIIKPKTFHYQVNIPYTAETLGGYRLSRANSGNYMNQVGLLNRIDLTNARSMQEINTLSYVPFKDRQIERQSSLEEREIESDANSEESDSESVESVKEAKLQDILVVEGEN